MAFQGGFNSRFFVGPIRMSAYGRGFDVTRSISMLDASTLENQAKVFIPGQAEGSASIDMLFDTLTTAPGQIDTINTWFGTPQPLTWCPRGAAINTEAQLILANQATATATSSAADIVGINVAIQPDGGMDYGVVIAAETAITIDTNGTSVDNSAATANGGVAHLHSTAYSGLTSNSVIIEHSTDNSAWSTLATFTLVSAVGSERLVVAPATTVNRYLRIRDDITGSGSHTRFVAFARR